MFHTHPNPYSFIFIALFKIINFLFGIIVKFHLSFYFHPVSTTFPISRLLNMSVDLLTMLLSYIIFFSFYSEPLFIPEIYEVRLSCQIFNSFGLAYVLNKMRFHQATSIEPVRNIFYNILLYHCLTCP